ncbi:MAG: methylmalonyl Co-A mutase-associated GTPase MeaB [Deltaproteobacteria bacterium]|nr:methylmalonyl Co-A mutase-associated GTPase MeaB [Deltaproteobacteria bacterium]
MERTEKILAGNVRVVSMLIRNLEDRVPKAKAAIRNIYPHTGKAHVIGFTGSPGAGKSTLIDTMIAVYRKQGKTVGALLVDPTSPFTGGAVLGDRVRMQRHAGDPGVFVRSLASRGALGGLSKAVGNAIHILDAMGKDIIIVETIGAGQQGVDIINHAHTVVVVQIPGMGDEIQTLKAGILEIADIFMINKADRDGGGKLYQELMHMLNMADNYTGGWRPPIIRAENINDREAFTKSVEDLTNSVDAHYQNLVSKNILDECLLRHVMIELDETLEAAILEPIITELTKSGELDRFVDKILHRELDPNTVAEEIAERYLKGYNREQISR